jgi:hypothetical protein
MLIVLYFITFFDQVEQIQHEYHLFILVLIIKQGTYLGIGNSKLIILNLRLMANNS